ncbi:restriction endonuclease subunit S [Fructilactobacillus vespulae]|uniref:restriction endonuclease subunit S n=1 Tax=Fructilactobacillus vespulae TaxID=1249630 RepID=UPI0039B4811E
MENNEMTPKIRFKGFSDPWEQRKLGNVGSSYSGLSGKTKDDFGHGEAKYVTYKDIFDNELIVNTEKFDNIGIDNSQNLVNKGDALFTISSEIPEEVGMSSVLMVTVPNLYLNSFCFGFRPNNSLSSLFLGYLFRSNYFRKKVQILAQGISRYNISKKKVMDINLIYPAEYLEQYKIGSLLKSIDQLITANERKIELLKEEKKLIITMLLNLFWRFKGFDNPWLKCKFEFLLDVNDGIRRGPFGSSLKKDVFVSKSDYVVYEQRNAIYDNYETKYNISKEKFEELKKFEIKPNDFIMSGAGTIGKISKVPFGIKEGVFNQALIRFRINKKFTDSNFFINFIRADFMQKKLTKANPGSAITNLVPMSEVKKWFVNIPEKKEQEKIGLILDIIDKKIKIKRSNIKDLKKVKKYLLQNMFI